MKSMGYDVYVVAKIHAFQNRDQVEAVFAAEGITLILIPHPEHPWKLLIRIFPQVLTNPALIDGAALEYADPPYVKAVEKAIQEFQPDLAWIEYTSLWPILRIVKARGVPCIIKSSLNEPANCRDENGWSIVSILKSLPKYAGERIAARESDFIFAISPVEEQWYRSWGAVHAGTLPLRGLAPCFQSKTHHQKPVLDVVFLSSTYNMGHNRDALEFLLTRIIPLVRAAAPGAFRFHLTGKKFPRKYERYLAEDVRTTGFVEDLGEFLATMDIALCPWISGTGMQQKVFEPLCRGLPLLTNRVAGYPFIDGEDVLLANTPEEFTHKLLTLRDVPRRQAIADAALAKAKRLFSEDTVKAIARAAIEDTLHRIGSQRS